MVIYSNVVKDYEDNMRRAMDVQYVHVENAQSKMHIFAFTRDLQIQFGISQE